MLNASVVILARVFRDSLDIPRATRTITRENTTPFQKVSLNIIYKSGNTYDDLRDLQSCMVNAQYTQKKVGKKSNTYCVE